MAIHAASYQQNPQTQTVLTRYKNAYRSARRFSSIASFVKGVAAFLIIAGVIACFVGASEPGAKSVIAISGGIFVFLVGALFFVLSVLVGSQAGAMSAAVDAAVFGCPFLTDDTRAAAMSVLVVERDPRPVLEEDRSCPHCGSTEVAFRRRENGSEIGVCRMCKRAVPIRRN